jgi:hypothetical protein
MIKPKTYSVILEILKILIQNQVADKYNFEPINVSKLLGSPKLELFLNEKTPTKTDY